MAPGSPAGGAPAGVAGGHRREPSRLRLVDRHPRAPAGGAEGPHGRGHGPDGPDDLGVKGRSPPAPAPTRSGPPPLTVGRGPVHGAMFTVTSGGSGSGLPVSQASYPSCGVPRHRTRGRTSATTVARSATGSHGTSTPGSSGVTPYRLRTRGPNTTRFRVPGKAADGTMIAVALRDDAHRWQVAQSSSTRAAGAMPWCAALANDTSKVSLGISIDATQGLARSSMASDVERTLWKRRCSAQQVSGCSDQYWTTSPSLAKRLSRRFGLAHKGVSQFASRKATSLVTSRRTNEPPMRGGSTGDRSRGPSTRRLVGDKKATDEAVEATGPHRALSWRGGDG